MRNKQTSKQQILQEVKWFEAKIPPKKHLHSFCNHKKLKKPVNHGPGCKWSGQTRINRQTQAGCSPRLCSLPGRVKIIFHTFARGWTDNTRLDSEQRNVSKLNTPHFWACQSNSSTFYFIQEAGNKGLRWENRATEETRFLSHCLDESHASHAGIYEQKINFLLC